MIITVDTNVFVGALLGPNGPSREVVRQCLEGHLYPLMGTSLFLEYEDVMSRPEISDRCLLSARERLELLDAFLSVCSWTRIFYGWRPNLRDEADNHLVELSVAGNADALVTWNTADFVHAELAFAGLRVLTPASLLSEEGR
ncbi:MAG: putative toxin-antitoxin system toxin component, PIN family [Alphaproteobacteria bacterium]